jgi:hypothetical protein
MPTIPLPENPDLGQLRNQARELQRAIRAGDSTALALVREFHLEPPAQATFPLSAAQFVLARRYDFPSWARLRRHVRIIGERSWMPGTPPPDTEPLPDRFLRLACLTCSDDAAADSAAAARLLAEHPELTSLSLPVAAACADVARVRAFLGADPSLATARYGPHGWSPLLYQAYARHDPGIGVPATLDVARLLLAAGADPSLRDKHYQSTPLGWARHFGQQPLVDLLEPLTPEPATPEPATPEPATPESATPEP